MGNQPSATEGHDANAHGRQQQHHPHQQPQHQDHRQFAPGYQQPQQQSQQPQQQSASGGYGGTASNLPFGAGYQGGAGGPSPANAMTRSGSDASMTLIDSDRTAAAVASSDINSTFVENWMDDDTVPTVFRWEHGGRQVYITGTFNGWSRQIPMHRSGNDFTYIHNLKRGKHAFKFIVDDEWRFAPDQPTVADVEGRINNFIDVTDFKAYTGDKEFEKEKAAAEYGVCRAEGVGEGKEESKSNPDDDDDDDEVDGMGNKKSKPDKDGEIFSQSMPDLDEYTKEPPPLPPHLRQIILNKPPQLQDTAALVVPQHVALNHLYCTAIRDNMMVLGITQRYKTKFVTTVYYSPCADKKF